MDYLEMDNFVSLRGTALAEARYSHAARAERFYTLPLEVRRLSGAADILNVTLRESMLPALSGCSRLGLTGELRTFNNRAESWPRLVITVFARELETEAGGDENLVRLRGTLCRRPNPRLTPMGREICDLLLAVNRHYGRSDYLPCICWGQVAREARRWDVGTRIALRGRIQSRRYLKQTESGTEERTAFEVSVAEAERLEEGLL